MNAALALKDWRHKMPAAPEYPEFQMFLSRLRRRKRPEPALFRQAALLCVASPVSLSRFESFLASGAWHEAAAELLSLCHPNMGYMSGKLPDGSAHVRLMADINGEFIPIDVYRGDGQLSLAIVEAVILGTMRMSVHESRSAGRPGRVPK